jgi:hypothetical protein
MSDKKGQIKAKTNVFCKRKEIEKAIQEDRTLFLLMFKGPSPTDSKLEQLPEAIYSLLQEYNDLFPDDTSKELPPYRGIEHRINLIPGAPLPNRPRYIFEPGDQVWVHFRKERFPTHRKSKLLPRGDGPFKVLSRINDNAYIVDLPSEYGVSNSFNVSDSSPFRADERDSRTNPPKVGGDVEDTMGSADDSVQVATGPITRARAMQLVDTLGTLLEQGEEEASREEELGKPKEKLVNLISSLGHEA